MKKKTLTIIDAYGFLFRAYYVLPNLCTSFGLSIGGVYGFINILLKYICSNSSDYLVIVFDTGQKNFRHSLYSQYKFNRPKPPDDLIPQFNLLREAVEAFNIAYEEVEGYEADDVIATISKYYGKKGDILVTIVSADKDLLQLMNNNVHIFDPIKNRYIDEEYVKEKYGVPVHKLLDLFSLTGDASDNIPGVPGIGIKTASKLLLEYGNLDNLLIRINEIKQNKCRLSLLANKEQAMLSKQLLTLCEEVPIDNKLEKYILKIPDINLLFSFLNKYEFKSLIPRIEKHYKFYYEEEEITNDRFRYFDTNKLMEFLEQCEHTGILAIYAEVDNQSIMNMTLSYNEDSIFYIDKEKVGVSLEIMRPILISDSVIKIMYDVKLLLKFIPYVEPYEDIMLMSYCVDAGSYNHSINNIVTKYLGEKYLDFKGRSLTSKTLVVLYKLLKNEIFNNQLNTIYQRFEKPLIKVLYYMEKVGILIDRDILKNLSSKFWDQIRILEEKIYEIAGKEFNIGSPKQLSDVLFRELKIEQVKKLKSGLYSTSAEVLEELSLNNIQIANEVLRWRHFSKLKNTYTDGLSKQINKTTNRIHTFYSMVSTSTGRLSSSNPNLQNIPIRSEEGNLIRSAFIAKKGYKFISADYSQIELRLIAHIAGVEAFKKAFSNDEDIHTITAKQIFGHVEVDKHLRRRAKSINFGIIYGISPYGLAKQLNISRLEAKNYIDYYFSCYPEIRVYMDEIKDYARRYGYVKTIFGRKCFIKDINSKNSALRNFAERACINAPLQGTAADIIKKSMINLFQLLDKADMILQVHDELLIEVADENIVKMAKVTKSAMEKVVDLTIPLTVDLSVGENWGEMSRMSI